MISDGADKGAELAPNWPRNPIVASPANAMSKHNQMIGRRGEKLFDLACSQAGVTCNRSNEDDFGWDMAIQFPPKPRLAVALDMQPGPVAAFVQVKATEGPGRSVSISLANALRYAESPIPMFLVLVALSDGPPLFFVKHVWTPLMASWLRAAREADAEGRTDTNHQQVTIHFEEADDHTDGLLQWMDMQIGAISPPYAAAKSQIFKTIGFENSHGTAKITFAIRDQNDLLELQLGLIPHIDASRFTFRSERFGIRAGQPEVDLSDVRITLTPHGRPMRLRATFPDGFTVAVDAVFHSAESAGTRAWRIAARSFELVHGPGGVTAKASLKAGAPASLEDLALFVRLQATMPGAVVTLEAEINGQSIDLGSIDMQGGHQGGGWPWLGLSIDVVRQVIHAAGRPVSEFTLADLNKASWQLEIMCALASERFMRLDFTPARGIPRKFAAMIAYTWAEVGDTVIGVVARRSIMKDQRKGRRRLIGFGAAHVLQGFVSPLADWSSEPLERAYSRQLEILADQGNILALGDLRIVASSEPGDRLITSDLPKRRRARQARP